MDPINRRQFLDNSARLGLGAAAGASLMTLAGRASATTANDKLALAIVGIRGRGQSLAADFAARPDCHVAWLCDVDASLFESRVAQVAGIQGFAPKTTQDFRRALDDKSANAIVVATPDHWHALATVWGCQAGKHVYVEKPVSHSPWEGRKMVEAARKYNRVVQAGTQNRSAPYCMKAREYIAAGKLGKIHLCRVYNQKYWGNEKPVADADPPAHLDWNMWNGPAPEHRAIAP